MSAFGQILNIFPGTAMRWRTRSSPRRRTTVNQFRPRVNQRDLQSGRAPTSSAKVASAQEMAQLQHFELGIARTTCFWLPFAAGLSEPLLGARVLPIGTYISFVNRGLDALFTPATRISAYALLHALGNHRRPEGGAHHPGTPLVGIGPRIVLLILPARVDELASPAWLGVPPLLQEKDGGSVYLRLTRQIAQPKREMSDACTIKSVAAAIDEASGARAELAIVYTGAIAPVSGSTH